MRLLAPLFLLSFVAAGICADTIVTEFTLPAGEVASFRSNGKAQNFELQRGPHVVQLAPDKPVTLEFIREIRYPVKFDPAQVTDVGLAVQGKGGIVPQTPTSFEATNAGWTITVEARPGPRIITLVGKATYTTVDLIQAVHGEGSGPITREYTDKRGKKHSDLISPNVGQSAVAHTTTTNFQLYATPGKVYKVPVRRGEKVVQLEVCSDYGK